MKVKYNENNDALYIDLIEGYYDKTRKVTDSILVDLTKDDKVIGIEILNVAENIAFFNPRRIRVNVEKNQK